jgi:NAD(P)-dependent dehydrogenase (short-subunit alcohol dehydrogenase family)
VPSEAAASGARLAIVTGASSGIGAALTEQLLAAGWRVIGLQRSAPARVDPAFQAVAVDLADGEALSRVAAELPTPHALVHAAGLMRGGRLGELPPADAAQMWRLHVDAATRLADALLPRMAAAGTGRVVLVGSRTAHGQPGKAAYAASKAALVSLARSWAAEVVARGVTVNVVSPAATDTPMLRDPARAGTAPACPPMGRLIRPDEVASLVMYLLSDAAAPITGQEIQVCGGASLPR